MWWVCDGVSCLHHLTYDLILMTWPEKISELAYTESVVWITEISANNDKDNKQKQKEKWNKTNKQQNY